MLDIIGELLFEYEDSKFSKRKKARRKFEKENNLPKKTMIHPVWMLLGVFIFITILVIKCSFFSNHGVKNTLKKMTKIEQILEKQKYSFGIYPEKLHTIIRNNPLRKKITLDYWNNEFYYKQSENTYILISKCKDGVLNTEDDINVRKNSK